MPYVLGGEEKKARYYVRRCPLASITVLKTPREEDERKETWDVHAGKGRRRLREKKGWPSPWALIC